MQTCLQLPGRNRLYGAVKFPSPISDFLPTCAQAIPVLRFGRRFVSALLPDGSVQAWVHGVRADRRPPLRKRKNSAKIFHGRNCRDHRVLGSPSADPEKKDLKKVRKKFGGKEKVRIFAVPFGNGGDCVSLQSLSETGVTESGDGGFRETEKIIDKAEEVQEQQSTENRKKINESVNSKQE